MTTVLAEGDATLFWGRSWKITIIFPNKNVLDNFQIHTFKKQEKITRIQEQEET